MKLFVSEWLHAGTWKPLNLIEGCFRSAHKLQGDYVELRKYNPANFRIRRVCSQREKDQYTSRGFKIVPLMRTEWVN